MKNSYSSDDSAKVVSVSFDITSIYSILVVYRGSGIYIVMPYACLIQGLKKLKELSGKGMVLYADDDSNLVSTEILNYQKPPESPNAVKTGLIYCPSSKTLFISSV
jgi:hypothetical protein